MSLFYFSFFLFIFLTNDIIMKDYFLLEGRYFFNHALHNLFISIYTFKNVQNSIMASEMISEQTLHPFVLPLVYSVHLYHIILYYEKINFSEKLHHFLCLGVAVPLVFLNFDNRDLLGYSFFATTGVSSIIHYFCLFLYKNQLLHKFSTSKINFLSNVYCRCPLIVTNSAFLSQYLFQRKDDLSLKEMSFGLILLAILLWNGIYFQKLVIEHYFRMIYNF